MVWALLLCFLVIIGLLSLHGTHGVPWGRKLKRLYAGVANKAEWMAPDEVVEQVRRDYLRIVAWLDSAPFMDHPRHRARISVGRLFTTLSSSHQPGIAFYRRLDCTASHPGAPFFG